MIEAYNWTKEFDGLAEIPGPKDNRMIEVAHRLTRIEGPKGGDHTDEIPWCSSWVVLAIVCANIRLNPAAGLAQLRRRKVEEPVIRECFDFAKVRWDRGPQIDTGRKIVEPTWSASSLSWDKWGTPVSVENARRGDLVRLTRKGGGHIAFLDADHVGKVTLTLLGGNQSNKVCSANWYLRTRLVTIRRAKYEV